MTAPQGWYDPSDAQLEEWVALLEGTLAAKWGLTRRKVKGWPRLCGEFCAAICDGKEPDTLRGLHWLQKWADAHGYV